MRVVIALGGNALLKRGEPMTAEKQRGNVRSAAPALAAVASKHELVLSHGNGPQVGLLALQAAEYAEVEPYPLDVTGPPGGEWFRRHSRSASSRFGRFAGCWIRGSS